MVLAIKDHLSSLQSAADNCSLQDFSILPHRTSGPVVLLAFTLLNTFLTVSSSISSSTAASETKKSKSVLV